MPDAIAHYKVLGALGTGGLGEVYRARDTALGRTVAVKVLPDNLSGDPARLDSLRAAAARLTALSHPNIAMLFECGQDADRHFLAFEYVQGQPLGSVIDGRPLNVRRAVEFGINLADALGEAHAHGLVHGDIRPDTIMITAKDRAKFMNFGLSMFTAGGADRLRTAAAYASPEEHAGEPPGAPGDIYALGAVMFEMLTGRVRSRGAVLAGLNPAVPAVLEQLVGRMLAAKVEHRAQSAAAVAAELRSIAADLDARADADEAPATTSVSRRPAAGARGGGAIVFAVAALAAAALAWYVLR